MLVVSAWVSVPVGTVPITLQVFFVLLTALLLPPWAGGTAVLIYLLLGIVGLPVFSGARGGVGIFFGPTGGYLLGFLPAVIVASWVDRGKGPRPPFWLDALASFLALIILYLTGWLQLMAVTGLQPSEAFLVGVLPFLGFDLLKTACVLVTARLLRQAGFRFSSP